MSSAQFEGYTFTKKYLSVHFKQSVGTTVRFETVKIMWSTLAKDLAFVEHLNAAVADEIRRQWGMGHEDYPLPFDSLPHEGTL